MPPVVLSTPVSHQEWDTLFQLGRQEPLDLIFSLQDTASYVHINNPPSAQVPYAPLPVDHNPTYTETVLANPSPHLSISNVRSYLNF